MQFFIKEAVDPNVPYHGHILPRDKVQYTPQVPDPNVDYHGATLPRDKVEYVPPTKDLTNNPSLCIIAGVTLPQDTIVYLTGDKMLVQSQILDGVSVFERILRKPYQIEFEMVIRQKTADGLGYVFPQDDLYNFWTKVWTPDSVQTVQNTYLNKLGISQIIIESVTPTTVRGSKNLPLRLKAWENVPGQSLIIG